MGELIILDEWKQNLKLKKLNMMEQELDDLMSYLSVKRQFFMFDAYGNYQNAFLFLCSLLVLATIVIWFLKMPETGKEN